MKKGFTLIELLAVITILALVALITSISVANMVKESKDELSDAQIKSIELAAKAWGADNITLLPSGDSCSFITLKDLKENGLLDSNILNPKDKEELSNDLKIKITSKLNSKGKSILTYEVNSSNVGNCSYIGNPIYVDLPKGLTPVIYDGTNWKVPELNQEWYDYDKQMWANAVVLGSGKTKKPGEIVTVEGDNPDALMMLVYIPRYEYKIEGQYGKGGQSAELPGEIEVNFIGKNIKTPTEGYIIHPAFNFDGEKSGFWVGKFELSHETLSSSTTSNNLGCSSTSCTNASGLRILPNKASLRYNNVSNFWYIIRSIESTSTFGLNNMDTHMMKNSEWGAVAYLSQSKYGKYGNSDYEGAQKEVYINNSSSFYTGRSGGNKGGNTQIKDTYTDQTSTTQYINYGYYTYDGYLLSYNTNNKTETRDINKGTGASTTGNIYGVYDMSGGSWEYVMGAYGPEYPTIGSSGFESTVFTGNTIESKYYDIYANSTNSTSNDGSQSCNNGVCLGHAMSETASWYGDYTHVVTSSYPWFLLGGYYFDNTYAGVFSRDFAQGFSGGNNSARVVGFGK